jgi:hypothetical protein
MKKSCSKGYPPLLTRSTMGLMQLLCFARRLEWRNRILRKITRALIVLLVNIVLVVGYWRQRWPVHGIRVECQSLPVRAAWARWHAPSLPWWRRGLYDLVPVVVQPSTRSPRGRSWANGKSPTDQLFAAAQGKPWRRDMWAEEVRSAIAAHNKSAQRETRVPTEASAYSFRHARISELLQVY